jgi:2-dehydro-3-deoxygluconokinase
MPFDVVAFGEAMVRLNPPHFQRLEQARTLEVEVGGAELNTAVGLARLGRSAAWVSRLTDNPLGRLIANRAREAGVSTEHVLFTPDDRVGVYFLEFGAAPRASGIVYDRKDSAASRLAPGMIDWPRVFAGSRWFHVTGITAALGASSADATLEAVRAARDAGLTVSLDLNYRAKLWTAESAGQWFAQAVPMCDVLFSNAEDVGRFFGVRGDGPDDTLNRLAGHFRLKSAAFSLREDPLVWRNSWSAVAWHGGRVFRTRTYELEIVDRLGAGDALASGLIHGLLDGDGQKAVDYGAALGALKHGIPGDFAWVTRDEVEALLAGGGLRIRR